MKPILIVQGSPLGFRDLNPFPQLCSVEQMAHVVFRSALALRWQLFLR